MAKLLHMGSYYVAVSSPRCWPGGLPRCQPGSHSDCQASLPPRCRPESIKLSRCQPGVKIAEASREVRLLATVLARGKSHHGANQGATTSARAVRSLFEVFHARPTHVESAPEPPVVTGRAAARGFKITIYYTRKPTMPKYFRNVEK